MIQFHLKLPSSVVLITFQMLSSRTGRAAIILDNVNREDISVTEESLLDSAGGELEIVSLIFQTEKLWPREEKR